MREIAGERAKAAEQDIGTKSKAKGVLHNAKSKPNVQAASLQRNQINNGCTAIVNNAAPHPNMKTAVELAQ